MDNSEKDEVVGGHETGGHETPARTENLPPVDPIGFNNLFGPLNVDFFDDLELPPPVSITQGNSSEAAGFNNLFGPLNDEQHVDFFDDLELPPLVSITQGNSHVPPVLPEPTLPPALSVLEPVLEPILPVDEATTVIAQQNPGVDEPILPPPVDEATNVIAQQNIEVDEPTLPPLVSITQGKRQLAKTKTQGKRYGECLKNHAVGQGGHVLDGCGEFMSAGDDALKCSACSCHRSFHRCVSSLEENMTSSGGSTRKRTVFSREQKDKMGSLAKSIGWRIQEKDDEAVKSLCEETGVSRKVFRDWMRYHKGKETVGNKP